MFESAFILKIGLVLSALVAFAAAKYYFRVQDDTVIEEFAEQVIQDQVGIAIDLTPSSPE